MIAQEAVRLAVHFGLHPFEGTARELLGGYSNETWLVEAEEGTHVVRRYGRLHVTARAIAFEHAILDHAAERSSYVRAPRRDSAGESYVLDHGAFVAAFPFIAGTTGDRSNDAAGDGARIVADYHRAVRDVHPRFGTRASRSLGILAWLRERFVRFAVDPVLRHALGWDGLIAACTAAAAHIAPRAVELPCVVVHGDPHPDNIVREGNVAAGLIDFDFAHETERAYDVAVLADEYARDDDDAPLDVAAVARAVDAYADRAPLTQAERALIPDFVVRRNATMVWYLVTRHGGRAPGTIGRADRYAARVAEVVLRRNDLASVLA